MSSLEVPVRFGQQKLFILLTLAISLLGCGKLDKVQGLTINAGEDPGIPGEGCVPDASGDYQDNLKTKIIEGTVGSTAIGCIVADITQVWKPTKLKRVLHWDSVDETALINHQQIPDPQYVHFDEVQYKVRHVFPVKWIMYWLHSVHEGSIDNPEKVVIGYQKVSGTRFIRSWSGSVVLRKVKNGVTEFKMLNVTDADRTDAQDTSSAIVDFYNRIMQNL